MARRSAAPTLAPTQSAFGVTVLPGVPLPEWAVSALAPVAPVPQPRVETALPAAMVDAVAPTTTAEADASPVWSVPTAPEPAQYGWSEPPVSEEDVERRVAEVPAAAMAATPEPVHPMGVPRGVPAAAATSTPPRFGMPMTPPPMPAPAQFVWPLVGPVPSSGPSSVPAVTDDLGTAAEPPAVTLVGPVPRPGDGPLLLPPETLATTYDPAGNPFRLNAPDHERPSAPPGDSEGTPPGEPVPSAPHGADRAMPPALVAAVDAATVGLDPVGRSAVTAAPVGLLAAPHGPATAPPSSPDTALLPPLELGVLHWSDSAAATAVVPDLVEPPVTADSAQPAEAAPEASAPPAAFSPQTGAASLGRHAVGTSAGDVAAGAMSVAMPPAAVFDSPLQLSSVDSAEKVEEESGSAPTEKAAGKARHRRFGRKSAPPPVSAPSPVDESLPTDDAATAVGDVAAHSDQPAEPSTPGAVVRGPLLIAVVGALLVALLLVAAFVFPGFLNASDVTSQGAAVTSAVPTLTSLALFT